MGSPTARRSITGIGVAAASKANDATREVDVNFMLTGYGVGRMNTKVEIQSVSQRSLD